MKFARVGQRGQEELVVIDSAGSAFRVHPHGDELDPGFLAGGGIAATGRSLEAGELEEIDISGLRFGSPIPAPTLLVCIGLNYFQHVFETKAEIPAEPVVFMKSPRTIIGPNDPVTIPRDSEQTDWEVELAVVIGKRTHELASPEDSAAHIAGYAISNDVSERSFQLERGGQWCKGKSCDTFNPLGPFLVTPDEIDATDLYLRLSVNGDLRQEGHTGDMLFDVDHIIWYLSQFMVLDAGDVINTGTPAGVALGSEGVDYLQPGDTVELQISGLGHQTHTLVEAS